MEKDKAEESIKIFVASIKTAEENPGLGVVKCSVLVFYFKIF
jgi:hypothetical protein